MSIGIGIGAMALLFALFALVRPRGCGGHCGGCSKDCAHHSGEDHSAT
ncbi:MAG: hypothetical protein U0974_10615 [Gemmatimonadales bacterium]|jgi:hypothetical protein|nr:hypothetical protein [Gemmatimonadales bacterium]